MTDYNKLNSALEAMIASTNNYISILSNASALLYEALDDVNWAGFYLIEDGMLVLGPFQGKAACTQIQIGKGVCGTAVKERKTQLVDNVHEFKGHIACDCASNSEIVVPIFAGEEIVGVIDIDSTSYERFSESDKAGLEFFSDTISKIFNPM